MNIYAVIPLVATIVYIPLLVITISSRPWQRKHKLFVLFLIAAMLWSLSTIFARSDLFLEYKLVLGRIVLVMLTWMVVQLHLFTSSFFSPGQRRWLPLAYGTLAAVITIAVLGYIPEDMVVSGNKIYPVYGKWIIFMVVPLLTLLARNLYVFWKRLKILDNPVLYNQIVSLVIGLCILTGFALTAFLPWGKEFPVSHLGNISLAAVLTYATIRHQLVDIGFILQRGLTWISLGVVGAVSSWLLIFVFHIIFDFEIDLTTMSAAMAAATLAAIFIYKLRDFFFVTMGKAFQRESYDHRQKLSDFANKIHHVFSLSEQGGELLTLVTKAIGCKKAGILFFEADSEDFTAQLVEPNREDNPLSRLRLKEHSPIVEYLRQERKPLTSQNLAVLPEFLSLWEQEKETIKSSEAELFMPLISRDRLIGILALDKKQSGRYLLKDFNLLEDITNQVAISMEKEYLREQLRQREEELSVINRSSAIITSSFDVQRIYGSFIQELKKVVDVSWAAITLIEENEVLFLALSTEIGSAWQAGERIPIKGTANEWVATHWQAIIESDLSQECRFTTGQYHLRQGVRSIAYLPLLVKGEVIGSLIVASRHPNAYSKRHLNLLEQLTSQIAMPIENSRLYAQVERRARIDELTGLLNRRSLDEMITSEIGRHSRYGGIFSLIILDLDSFKAYNDNYGHLAGDKILSKIGSIMKSTIRDADQAFRYGGDEFAILLPQTSDEAAYEVAERIRKRVAASMNTGPIPITTSLGLASWPADGIEPEAIIAAADTAQYRAKRNGGNQSYLASGDMVLPDDKMIGYETNKDSEALSNIYAVAATVDVRDHYTRSHSKKVSKYAVALAEALNMEPLEINRLGTCALLHDIGKIGISDEILSKKGKLTAEEWEKIKVHPELGASIASRVSHLSHCIPCILHHHERYDGNGYPKGLKGEEIPLEARILAIADAFTAMTSERPFSKPVSYEEAKEEIKRGAGTQFDPKLAEVFLSVIKNISVATTSENKV